MTILPDWLAQRAKFQGDRLALSFANQNWTFADLEKSVRAIAYDLVEVGVTEGSYVALLMENHPILVMSILALTKLGAIAVHLNPRLSDREIHWQLSNCEANLLIYDQTYQKLALQIQAIFEQGDGSDRAIAIHSITDLVKKEIPPTPLKKGGKNSLKVVLKKGDKNSLKVVLKKGNKNSLKVALKKGHKNSLKVPLLKGDLGGSMQQVILRDEIDLDAVQGIIYTSGTTGLPKGVQLTYGNHFHNAIAAGLNLGVETERDRWLICLPLSHVGGLSIIWRSLIYGTGILLQQRFDAEKVISAIATQPITIVSLVATMLTRIIASPNFPATLPAWQKLRYILLGGAPSHAQLLAQCQQFQLPIALTYGLTEAASQVATIHPQDGLRKPYSVGQPLSCNSLRVVALIEGNTEQHLQSADMPIGEIGEILIKGANITTGYINHAQPNLANGWFATGDLGYLDADGFLYVVSRRSDLIISGGENIYPAEIEAILWEHPQIKEVCVVGVPNTEWGQIVVAAIAPENTENSLDLEEIREFCCDRHLARYKLPKAIYLVDTLPKTASGKLNRQQIFQQFCQNDNSL